MAQSQDLRREVDVDTLQGLPFDLEIAIGEVVGEVALQVLQLLNVVVLLLWYGFLTLFGF